MTSVLLAGDGFVRNELLAAAVAEGLGRDVTLRTIELAWPYVPFGRVGEVDEASGTEDELIEALDGVDACLTQMAPLTERILAARPGLRLFAVSRGGPVNANLPAASAHGVVVTFAPGRNATATAEYTMGMMLAAMRRIPATHGAVTAGEWPSALYAYDAVGPELAGATVGLIGAGAIGGRVARLAAAFDARVLVYDPHADPAPLAGVAEFAPLDTVLASSQVLSLHARLTPETAGLIDREAIARMPRGAVLVNCARGGLLDAGALADALRSGHLHGAALDVFDLEPLPPDSPLRTAPNLVVTPHLGGASRQVAVRAAAMVAEELRRYVDGEPPRHCANPDVLAGSTRN